MNAELFTPSAASASKMLSRAIPASERMIRKRDGTQVRFDQGKINRAVALAFHDTETEGAPNPHRDDPLACFGLDAKTFEVVGFVGNSVSSMLELYYRDGRHPTVEEVQDAVEKALAASGNWDVARLFMLYRARQAERRLVSYSYNGLSDYIVVAKYARYRPDLRRRETFAEGAERVRDMHLKFFADKLDRKPPRALPAAVRELAGEQSALLEELTAGVSLRKFIERTFAEVAVKRVLPSMRSMQFGGEAILANHSRMFNCSYSNVDRIEFFREYFHLLLSGCGVGFSVQKHHVAMLPPLPFRDAESDLPVVHHTVADTIEGWADSLHALFMSFMEGRKVEFNFSAIRHRGVPLKTSGGRAPGHIPLKKALHKIEHMLEHAAGRRLRPVEVYDINMFIAKAVLAGGIRRSATIALFSPDDEEMMSAKTGDWFDKHPQRSASNNSAVLNRHTTTREQFDRLFKCQKEFGEPGFYFCDNPDAGCNPCAEIGLLPVVNWELAPEEVAHLYEWGYQGELPGTTRLSGFQHCNLSTINGGMIENATDFYKACVSASIIGTLQAAYTDMPYLSPVTRLINEHDALLGVSICGYMDNPDVLFDPKVLAAGAQLCRAANALVAGMIGIRPAARVTTTKPEGTVSLATGSASGIHPHHARRYFRRVQANRKEPVYQFFKKHNEQMTEVSVYNPDTDDVMSFPVEAPKRAIVKGDLNAVQFLDLVKLVQRNWVLVGDDDNCRSPEVTHNVSNTCTVRNDEWDGVADYIWENREFFTGVSLLQETGDKAYMQAPREEVVTEADILKWNLLRPRPVDYTQMREDSDRTELKEQVACAGGACELVR